MSPPAAPTRPRPRPAAGRPARTSRRRTQRRDEAPPRRTHPRLFARKVAVERERGRRRLRVLLVGLLLLGLSIGALAVVHSRLFSARNVLISAGETTRAEVLSVTGLAAHPPLIDVSPAADAALLRRLPWVTAATVAVEWPSTVRVGLTEAVPVARYAEGAGRVAVLDASGRVLEVTPRPPSGLVALQGHFVLPDPGGYGAAPLGDLCALAGALPPRVAGQVASLERQPGTGLVAVLDSGADVVFASAADLRAKVVALATVAQSVPLGRGESLDLRVPSAPVLTP